MSILQITDANGNSKYLNVRGSGTNTDPFNPIQEVNIGDLNTSAFGDLIALGMEPVIQLDFVHGINIQTGVSTVANSAAVDTDSGRLRLQSGTNSAGSAIFNSKRPAKYRAGQGMVARFTPLFTTGVVNNVQGWGVGNINDGYFFGYNGTAFGILHRIRTVDAWIPQTTWNVDKCDGTGLSAFNWDKTKGVPVMIQYPYLGYGDVKFFVQNPNDGRWILAHIIKYANTVTTTQAGNPNLFFYGFNVNSGNTSNITMYCGSVGVFITGHRSYIGSPRWAMDAGKLSLAASTDTNLLSIKNATTYNGVANRSLVRLHSLSVGSNTSTGSRNVTLKIRVGATVGGTPSFTTINGTTADGGATITAGNSIASYDTAGTTVSGGTYIYNLSMGTGTAGNTVVVDLSPYDIFIAPSEILTISANPNGTNTDVSVSLNWSEDI